MLSEFHCTLSKPVISFLGLPCVFFKSYLFNVSETVCIHIFCGEYTFSKKVEYIASTMLITVVLSYYPQGFRHRLISPV